MEAFGKQAALLHLVTQAAPPWTAEVVALAGKMVYI
jgi:hypothetical protein